MEVCVEPKLYLTIIFIVLFIISSVSVFELPSYADFCIISNVRIVF